MQRMAATKWLLCCNPESKKRAVFFQERIMKRLRIIFRIAVKINQ